MPHQEKKEKREEPGPDEVNEELMAQLAEEIAGPGHRHEPKESPRDDPLP
jgi:hypothetical protein